MNTPITKDQIKSLLLNAYVFMSRSDDLYFCAEDFVHDNTFELVDNDGGRYGYTYTDAFVCNGSVTFKDPIFGEFITFTILVVPTDSSGLMPKLLACN